MPFMNSNRSPLCMILYLIFALSIFFLMSPVMASDPYVQKRAQMVQKDIRGRGVKDPKVLEAMEKIPRHLFVDESFKAQAYADHPLPIGEGQTISQPYVVALMTHALRL